MSISRGQEFIEKIEQGAQSGELPSQPPDYFLSYITIYKDYYYIWKSYSPKYDVDKGIFWTTSTHNFWT